MNTCSQQRKNCVKWVEKYFKDCVCDAKSKTSFGFGIVGLFCWGIAEIPQIITNFRTKSGHGVSLALLLTWVLGDVFNLVGCLLEPVTLPTQLYTALLYTATTVVLVLQTIYYDYWVRWKKNRDFVQTRKEDDSNDDGTEPLNPKREDPAKPIFTINPTSPRTNVFYTSARSMANSGSSPYNSVSYLRPSRSGPSNIGAVLHNTSSDDEDDVNKTNKFSKTNANIEPSKTISRSLGYGTFIAAFAGLPNQAKALVNINMVVHAQNMLQETGPNVYGMVLGWIMAAIYMSGRLPQIYLNIKRGNVEGLNPLMFIFALIANASYVASILVRSVEWYMIKANAP